MSVAAQSSPTIDASSREEHELADGSKVRVPPASLAEIVASRSHGATPADASRSGLTATSPRASSSGPKISATRAPR